jgi:hypothetical protein
MSFRSRASFHLSLVCLLALNSTTRGADGTRTWHDVSGKYSVQAALVKQTDDAVQLRTAEGRLITIPLAKLSAADRDHLASLTGDNPFAVPAAPVGEATLFPATLVVEAKVEGEVKYSAGFLFNSDKDNAYILGPAIRFYSKDKWIETDEVTVIHETKDGARRVKGRRLFSYFNQDQTLYAVPAGSLPAAPALAPAPARFPTPVRVMGYRVDNDAKPPTYERIALPATLVGVALDAKQSPLMFKGNAENLRNVRHALLVDDTDRVLGYISVSIETPRPPGSNEPNAWTFQAMEFSRTLTRLQPALVHSSQAVPVAGDRQATEYELVIYVNDPLKSLRDPMLHAYPGSQLAVVTGGPPAELRRERPIDVPLKTGAPSQAALPYLVGHEAISADATVYVGRLKRQHDGVPMEHAFNVELVDRDAAGKETSLGWTMAKLQYKEIPGKGRPLPAIPGVDGLPIDMPRPVRLPQGGWRLTSAETRVPDQPRQAPDAAFPTPRPSDKKIAGEVKTVGENYGLVELALSGDRAGGRAAAFSADGAWLYYVNKANELHKIATKTLRLDRVVQLGADCDHLSISKAGLIVPLRLANVVWVLDPQTLEVRREMRAPNVSLVVGAPGTDLGFFAGQHVERRYLGSSPELTMVDFSTGTPLHAIRGRYDAPSQVLKLEAGGRALLETSPECLRMTRDGKYLFVAERNVNRFRVDGNDLVFEQAGPNLHHAVRNLSLSGDGKWLAAPTRDTGCDVYDAMDMGSPRLTLSITPKAIAFDHQTQGIFGFESYTNKVVALGPRGGKTAEFATEDGNVGLLLMHPEGGRFVVFGERKLYYCDTLESRLRDDLILAGP